MTEYLSKRNFKRTRRSKNPQYTKTDFVAVTPQKSNDACSSESKTIDDQHSNDSDNNEGEQKENVALNLTTTETLDRRSPFVKQYRFSATTSANSSASATPLGECHAVTARLPVPKAPRKLSRAQQPTIDQLIDDCAQSSKRRRIESIASPVATSLSPVSPPLRNEDNRQTCSISNLLNSQAASH